MSISYDITSVTSYFGITLNGRNPKYMEIPCPYCGKPATVNIQINGFKCFHCGEAGNSVVLYGALAHKYLPEQCKKHGSKAKEIIKEYAAIFNDEGNHYTAPENEILEQIKYQKASQKPVARSKPRNLVYSTFLNLLPPLSDSNYNDLILRGFTPQAIKQEGFKTFPQDNSKIRKLMKTLVESVGPENMVGVPGFYPKNGEWSIARYESGYLIPMRDLNGKIEGLQFRSDHPKDSKKRYRWFSSPAPHYEGGASALTWSSFYGFSRSKTKKFYLTEGPLKAKLFNLFTGYAIFAVPGIQCLTEAIPSLQVLKTSGITEACPAFDMDFLSNTGVEKGYRRLIEMLENMNFKVTPKGWNTEYKGIDDFTLAKVVQAGFKFGFFRISSENLTYWKRLFNRIEITNNPIRQLNLKLVKDMPSKIKFVHEVILDEFSRSSLSRTWKIKVVDIPEYQMVQIFLTKFD